MQMMRCFSRTCLVMMATLVIGCSGSDGGGQTAVGTGGQSVSGVGGNGNPTAGTTGGSDGPGTGRGGSVQISGSGGDAGSGGPGDTGGAGDTGAAGNTGSAGNTGGSASASAGSSGGTATGGSGGRGAAGGTSGTGGIAGGSGSGAGGSAPVTPPVSDASSKLGISAPGSGNHVEGNIAYGPFTMQRLDVIYPDGAGPKGTMTLPGVVMFHGGGWIDNKPQALKASMSSFFSRFLKHGFLVCNVEYRLADGTANGAIAPAADQDALLAARWFWDHMDYYHVDKTKYVVTGASAGGQLALMVGMATADAQLGPSNPTDFKIAAVVNGYGPADVTDLLAKKIGWAVQWLPASVPNRAALAKQVSPVTYVRKDVPPLITVQGMDDTTVPTSEAQNLYDLLTAAGADTALHYVAGAKHGFSTPASAWPDAEATMFDFLVKHGIGK